MSRQVTLIGNWKMNGSLDLIESFADASLGRFRRPDQAGGTYLGLAVPDVLLYPAAGFLSGTPFALGIQDCHGAAMGAHTGESSAAMAGELGAEFAIVGHSERRTDQGETSAQVRVKALAAQDAGLRPIICIGETLAERQAGKTLDVVLTQLAESIPGRGDYIIAYEPVWAIGTGEVATPAQAQEVHAAIRAALPDSSMLILYGGSMKPANAADLLAQADIDGGLIGGASLNAQDFLAIFDAAA